MDWSALVRLEWLIIELIVLALVAWQFISINRAVKRDREEKRLREAARAQPEGTPGNGASRDRS